MGNFIIKASPDRDMYMLWSSIVEAPLFVGQRAELTAYLRDRDGSPAYVTEPRIGRAIRTGTSAVPDDDGDPYGSWKQYGFIYEQRGWLLRNKVGDLCDLLIADPNADAGPLLVPFEDEDEVRP